MQFCFLIDFWDLFGYDILTRNHSRLCESEWTVPASWCLKVVCKMSNSVNSVRHIHWLSLILAKRGWKIKGIVRPISDFLPLTHSGVQTKWDWKNVFPSILLKCFEMSALENSLCCAVVQRLLYIVDLFGVVLHIYKQNLWALFWYTVRLCLLHSTGLFQRCRKCSVLSPVFWSGVISLSSKI